MSKIVVTEFLSLDGVMEDPAWTVPYWNDEIAKFKYDELFASGAHLLGRITYQGFAAAWPDRKDEQGFADRMNSLPKFVVSTTLKKGDWQGTTIIKENVVEEISGLNTPSGQDILVAGSATLVQALMHNNLVDEYHFLIYPVVLGKGKRIFPEGIGNHTLKLVESRPFDSGVVLLRYTPEREAPRG